MSSFMNSIHSQMIKFDNDTNQIRTTWQLTQKKSQSLTESLAYQECQHLTFQCHPFRKSSVITIIYVVFKCVSFGWNSNSNAIIMAFVIENIDTNQKLITFNNL